MSKTSLLSSIAKQKCPSCRKGKMFIGHTYNLKNFNKMHDKCPNCGHSFELEPGFYMGAMYVSYALQLVLFVSVFATTQIFYPEAKVIWYTTWVIAILLLLFPIIFRLSRAIWLHLFVPYHAQNKEKLENVTST